MSRWKLAPFVGQRWRFVGTLEVKSRDQRSGTLVVLIRNVTQDKNPWPLADHVWIGISKKEWAKLPENGNKIAFDATIQQYTKRFGQTEYGLCGLRNAEPR